MLNTTLATRAVLVGTVLMALSCARSAEHAGGRPGDEQTARAPSGPRTTIAADDEPQTLPEADKVERIPAVGLLPGEASRGARIAVDWRPGQERPFPSVPLYFFRVGDCPVVYRTVVELGARPALVVAKVAASAHAIVFVNGVKGGAVVAPGKNASDRAGKPVEALMDLTERFEAGKNVLVVSAPESGFAFAATAVLADGSTRTFGSDSAWKVRRFKPVTILEDEPALTDEAFAEFDPALWAGVKETGVSVELTPDEAYRGFVRSVLARKKKLVSDVVWRAEILRERGILVRDWKARRWAGAGRLRAETLAAAEGLRRRGLEADGALASMLEATSVAECEFRELLERADGVVDTMEALTVAELCRDEARHLRAVARCIGVEESVGADLDAARLDEARRKLEAEWDGLPIPRMNGTYFNRFGWMDDAIMVDGAITEWGLRVNPIDVSWRLNLDGKWRFKIDPENTGLSETVHTKGYNIEGQWPEIKVPGDWESQGWMQVNPKHNDQSPYPGVNRRTDGPYNGWAWFRKTLRVPDEWRGNDLEVTATRVDDWDWCYFNGKIVGHTGHDNHPKDFWKVRRRYRVPKELVEFGGYNVIVFRVFDCGALGELGSVELRCPALRAEFENRPARARARTEVLSTPLFPASLVTVGEKDLELFGWENRNTTGPALVAWKSNGTLATRRIEASGTLYERAADGELDENWLLLWCDAAEDLPILVVLAARPEKVSAVRTARGTSRVTITFPEKRARSALLRPFRSAGAAFPSSAEGRELVLRTCRFWSRAALAFPMEYSEIARRVADDPWTLEVIDIYHYRTIPDAWNTEPVRLAPVPLLLSYALSTKYAGLVVGDAVKDLDHPLPEWGRYRAAVGTDRVIYRIPVDRIPRFGGYTSFQFNTCDIGSGTVREFELVATTGANSVRPQNNQRYDEMDEGEAMAETCARLGMQLQFNMDNCDKDWVPRYEKLAALHAEKPFWNIGYDIINEPANMTPEVYNPLVKKIVEAIRKHDRRHLIYIETPHSFASVLQFKNLTPVDDPLVVYSYHDYDYRLPERWPTTTLDVSTMSRQFLPALKYMIDHRAPLHLGEWGGFDRKSWTDPCTRTLMWDFFGFFDQFNMHFNYYPHRGCFRTRADGSVEESLVAKSVREYFAGTTFNWPFAGTDAKNLAPASPSP